MKHYCTLFSDSFLGVYLKNYCKRHDEKYAVIRAMRLKADEELRDEIKADNTKIVARWLCKGVYFMTRVFGRLAV